jgi:cell division protein ZapA
MKLVMITLNGRTYEIACEEGQEDHVRALAADIDGRIAGLVRTIGQVGEARLLVLASLLVADELAEARARTAISAAAREASAPAAGLGARIESLAQRIDGVAHRLAPA